MLPTLQGRELRKEWPLFLTAPRASRSLRMDRNSPPGEPNPGIACLQSSLQRWVTVPEQTDSQPTAGAKHSYPGGADTLALIPELAHKALLSPHVESTSFRCLET